MMDLMGMGWMALIAVLAAIVVAAIVVAVLRGSRGRSEVGDRSARSLLDERLAAGEIDAEDYYEREAALRSSEPATRPPGRFGRRT